MVPTHGCVPIEGYTWAPVAETRTFKFRSRPEAVSAARRALDGFDEQLEAGTFYDASLCVSELVTNAVLHADIGPDDELVLEVTIDDGVLRVVVNHDGEPFEPPEPSMGDESGWGLFIVDRLSHRWGVEHEGGTCVWFEMGVPPVGEAAAVERAAAATRDDSGDAVAENVRTRSVGRFRARPQTTA
jgi:anti-sigma regulatory factor (Ser/Thr protein kinase)